MKKINVLFLLSFIANLSCPFNNKILEIEKNIKENVWDSIIYTKQVVYQIEKSNKNNSIEDTIEEIETIVYSNGETVRTKERYIVRIECNISKCVKKLYNPKNGKWIEIDSIKDKSILVKK